MTLYNQLIEAVKEGLASGIHNVFLLGLILTGISLLALFFLKEIPLRGMAVIKAPFKAKVVTKLVITAINLFRRDPNLNPIAFFDTEEEGREWIASRRKMFVH